MILKNKAQAPKLILSLADHKRAVSLFQLLVTIDKRVNGSGSKQSKTAPKPGREVGSLKKRAYLILVALCMLVAALLLVQLQHNKRCYNDAIKHGPSFAE